MKETFTFGAIMIAELIRDGKVIETRTAHNMVVSAGYDWVCDLLGNSTRPSRLGYVGVGTGTANTTSSMTTLGTAWGSRASTTYAHTAGTTEFTLQATIPAHSSGNVNITEAGIFSASSGGTMFDRVTFTAISKAPSDTINFRFLIRVAPTT